VLWLIAELARMCGSQVKQSQPPYRRELAERVAEAEAILRRAGDLTTRAVVMLPRADTKDSMRLVSRLRFAANYDLVREAAGLLERAVEAALAVGVQDLEAVAVAATARQLTAVAQGLRAEYAADGVVLSDALGLRS
jgi:hypothetical protein